jgi:hypothetical protein
MASLQDYTQQVSDPATQRALDVVLSTILTDLTALAAAIAGITAQLDADVGVTDTDYAANNNPTLTLTE